jgi:ATP-binding cassette subfamily B protein
VGAVVVLVLRAAHGQGSPGEVVEAVSLLRRAQRQVSTATDTATNFADVLVTAGRFLWLEDYGSNQRAESHGPTPSRLREGIRFENVSFTYANTSAPALAKVHLELPAGATVALVGENGAGRTTIVKLLTGMYRPDAGRIIVDGVDLNHLDVDAWRRTTTATFQDHLQFQMRYGDGVGVGDLTRVDDHDAIRSAIDRAGAAGDLSQMPRGLDTLVGTYIGGRGLSGGQWKRSALARGLMRQSPLLMILDEPTTNLDAPTERALFERYHHAARRLAAEQGTITLLITHRFSTVRTADVIIVCQHGRIVETGTHHQLLDQQGLYAELYELQAAGYRSD